MKTTDVRDTPKPAPAAPAEAGGGKRRFRLPDPLAAIVVAATAVFALAGIGGPLLGLSVFADTGTLRQYSGYRDVLAGTDVQNNYMRDVVDSAMPNSILFGEALRAGDFAAWNPYTLGGGPLGSNPNAAVASPLSAPWWLLPAKLAPGYVKLLEIICAVGGMVLFLRRLRLSRAAAWLGGLVFASSAFMVAWSGWPQTRVACLIPALFWALERLAQRPRPREVALVSLPVAGMLLGGFPAVVGYTLLVAGAYLLVRVLGEHRAWRPVLARLGAAAGGVVAGVGLVAWQLVPWVQFMATAYVMGRAQTTEDHIPADALLTAIAPFAFGSTNPAHPPDWFGSLELIDAESYLGAAALVLVVVSVALADAARRLLPRGVWWTFFAASALWITVIYAGGPLLALSQHTPFLFSENFVGRARSALGMCLAVLAAVGFEVLLRGRRERDAAEPFWPRKAYGVGVWTMVAVSGLFLYRAGRAKALASTAKREPGTPGPDYLSYLHSQLAIGLAIMIVAGGCAAWLWWRPRWDGTTGKGWLRLTVAALVPLLVAAQALAFVRAYYPRTDPAAFYPSNPTQQFLAAHLGHERYFGADGSVFGSVDATVPLRGFNGHAFIERGYAELADSMPGKQFQTPTTTITSESAYAAAVAVNPVLDRAAVRYYVAPPELTPFGKLTRYAGDGSDIDLQPGVAVTVGLRTTSAGLRGIGVVPTKRPSVLTGDRRTVEGAIHAPPAPAVSPVSSAHLRVTVRDSSGRIVANGERLASTREDDTLVGGAAWLVPLAGEDIPTDSALSVELTALGTTPLRVSASTGQPALATVSPVADGLRLVYAHESVIYERTTALPRARWASSDTVVADPTLAVRAIASSTVPLDTVVLATPGPAASGRPAEVSWITDGLDDLALSVRADGAGYLVLADAIQQGWKATVDGVDADLVTADHAFVAVAVPAGTHTVRFSYQQPFSGPGVYLTGFTVLALLAILGAEYWYRRHPVASMKRRRARS